jgi:hypothetical protein
MPNKDVLVALAIVGFLFGLGLMAGYWIWGREVVHVVEDFAPAIEMDDGSKVLSREPDGKPSTPAPRVPKDHKPVRTIEVTVNGSKPVLNVTRKVTSERGSNPSDVHGHSAIAAHSEVNSNCYAANDFTCPSSTVRIDLLRAPDGTYRAQASSADGIVLDGVDIPLEDALVSRQRPWAVGYERTIDGSSGAFIERDVGRLRVGATVIDGTAAARIGWRF